MLATKFSGISSGSMKGRLRIRLGQDVSLMQSQLHGSAMKPRLIGTIPSARYWWRYLHFQVEFLRLRYFIRARGGGAAAAGDARHNRHHGRKGCAQDLSHHTEKIPVQPQTRHWQHLELHSAVQPPWSLFDFMVNLGALYILQPSVTVDG